MCAGVACARSGELLMSLDAGVLSGEGYRDAGNVEWEPRGCFQVARRADFLGLFGLVSVEDVEAALWVCSNDCLPGGHA